MLSEQSEAEKFNTELTKSAVEIRQLVQDFPLCSTFKEIDEQNALVRSKMETMRLTLGRLERVGRESMEAGVSFEILETVERHRDQLTACQRQFRMANVKVFI